MSKLCQRDYPHRLLPLRPAFGYLYRGAGANFGLSRAGYCRKMDPGTTVTEGETSSG